MKRIVSFGIVLFLFIVVAPPVDAKVWVNEFSSDNGTDWVEIYNDSESDVIPLSTFLLKDGSSSGNPLSLSGILSPKGYMVFEWGMSLNKTGDIIRLIDTVSGTEVDTVIYGIVEGKILDAPLGGQYGARKTDGGAEYAVFTSETKGSTNGTAIQAPTATPEPTSTPKPTATPTKVPTPTKTPTPTKFPSPTTGKTPTLISKGVTSAQSRHTPTIDHHVPTAVLAAKTTVVITTGMPTMHPSTTKVLGTKGVRPAFVYVGMGGTLLIICAILAYQRYRNTE